MRYPGNTLPTVVYYTGSDDAFDYFYLDVPLGQNEAVKVPRGEVSLEGRMPRPQPRSRWRIYRTAPAPASTNTVILLPQGGVAVPF